MKLYSYFRSSAAYRVRIALALKGIDYEYLPVHLLRNGGEQHSAEYKALNASELVPTLVDGELAMGQSMAILEYLEETVPWPALLPENPAQRARIRAFTQSIACDIHPLNNLRVLQYLKHDLQISDDQKNDWYSHWVRLGLNGLEQQLVAQNAQHFCFGEQVSLADCCLIPQVYNALRFDCDMSSYPKIHRIYTHCMGLAAFQRAAPDNQPDAEGIQP